MSNGMNIHLLKNIQAIFTEQKKLAENTWDVDSMNSKQNSNLQSIIDRITTNLSLSEKTRIESEFNGYGPLEILLSDPEITEVIANSFDEIYYEKKGFLISLEDHFFSEQTYNAALDRLSQNCHSYLNREKPFIESQLKNWRVTILFSELSRGSHLLSIRKQPQDAWTLEKLYQAKWCSEKQLKMIEKIFSNKSNFLVVGGTGSGKTSFLQSILGQFSVTERAVIIEDTQELHLPNSASCSLLTRQDPSRTVGDITMDDLLKRALRLRSRSLSRWRNSRC